VASPAADIRNLAVVGLASLAGAILAPGVPFLGVPLAAAALGWLAYRHGYTWAVVAALLTTAVTVVLAGSVLLALVIGLVLLAAGPGVAWALTRWQAQGAVAALTVVVTLSTIAFSAITAAAEGTTFLAQRAAEGAAAASMLLSWGARSSLRSEAAQQLADRALQTAVTLWPSYYFYLGAAAAVLAVPLVSRAGRVLGRTVSALPPLPELDITPHIVWPAIAGIGLLAAATFQRQPSGLIEAAGANLLLVVRPALFFQGLGNFAALYKKAGVRRPARMFGFTFLTLSELVIPSVSVIGLADMFVNLRKLPRRGEDARTTTV
jgi:Predicted membrane protein (DUF2232)